MSCQVHLVCCESAQVWHLKNTLITWYISSDLLICSCVVLLESAKNGVNTNNMVTLVIASRQNLNNCRYTWLKRNSPAYFWVLEVAVSTKRRPIIQGCRIDNCVKQKFKIELPTYSVKRFNINAKVPRWKVNVIEGQTCTSMYLLFWCFDVFQLWMRRQPTYLIRQQTMLQNNWHPASLHSYLFVCLFISPHRQHHKNMKTFNN